MQVLEPPIVRAPQPPTQRSDRLIYHRKWINNALVMGIGDGVALAMALLIAGTLRWWFFGASLIPAWSWVLPVGWWTAAFMARILPGWGMGAVEELRRMVILLSLLFGGTMIILFLTKQATETSRFTLSISFMASLVLVPFLRTRVKRWLIRRQQWGLPVVLYGAGETGRRVLRSIQEEPGLGYIPIGVFDDDPELWGDYVEGVPVVGEAEQYTAAAPVAILAMPGISRVRMLDLVEGPLAHYKHVVIVPDLFDIPSLWVRSRNMAGVLGLEITRKLLDPVARVTKRTLDLLFILVTSVLVLPLYLLTAALIWLEDRHNPFYYQERVGQGGRLFKVHKFRTMVPDAEVVLVERLAEDPVLRDEWERNFKLRHDPRITRVGAFLRKTSLDEIPQLINVLRGEMSLVGPRPLPHYHHDELPERVQHLRMQVRPGMTGLWQISGRSEAGNEGLIRWDAYYVRNWSVWLDMVILVRTIRVVLRGDGAY